jgi:AhpD family alkylhydroperoxidase
MHARIDNPALTVPGALKALQGIGNTLKQVDIPETTPYLVELRASQINGCGVCVDIHTRELKHAGEPDERINTVAAWRDVSYFTEAERAALALTEAATRLADRPDPVPDEVWDNAARHYDDAQLAALVLAIAAINAWNRLNVTTRQISGDWVASGLPQARGRERRPDPSGSTAPAVKCAEPRRRAPLAHHVRAG